MSTEDRLRDALHATATQIEPREGWTMIESRLSKAVPTNRTRLLAIAAAAALVLVAGVAVLTQQDDDGTPVVTEPDTTTTTIDTPTSTTAVPVATAPTFVWPATESEYRTPRDLATTFARDFLNMPNPNVGEYQAGDSRSGEIVVHPKPTGSQSTTVLVREHDSRWYVVAANADNLELDTPAALARITSPVHLTGRSIAFEGTVSVAVLRYGTTLQCTVPTDVCGSDPGVYANTFFTGSGDEKRPFEADITFSTPQTELGYVVLWTNSAEDGSVSEATVRLIRFR
jgi:hypothetical protein